MSMPGGWLMPFPVLGVLFGAIIGAVSSGISALVAKGIAAVTFSTLMQGAVMGGLSGLLGMVSKPKQDAGYTAEARDRQHVIRSAIATRTIIYGQAMVSGPLVFAAASGDGNCYLHLVIPLAGHEVEEITTVYFNDRPEWETVGYPRTEVKFFQSDFFGLRLTVDGATFTAETGGVADLEAAIRAAPRYAGAAYQVDRVGNTLVFTGREIDEDEMSNAEINAALAALESVMHSVTAIQGRPHAGAAWSDRIGASLVGEVTFSKSGARYARVNRHLGSPDQEADADLMAEVPGWTANHRLRGVAYIYVRLLYDSEFWASGVPNIKAVVRGKKVFDPRTGQTAWSDNWALCLRDYIASPEGLNAPAEIDEESAKTAADISDQLVTGPAAVSSRRYTCNGVISLDTTPHDAVQHLASAGAGAVVWSQGRYRIHAGAYTAPTVLLTEDDLRGDLVIRPRAPRRDLFNGVRGTYIDPDKFWQPTDFPIIKSAVHAAEDGGEEILRDIDLPFTANPHTAQQIAKIVLQNARQALTVEFPGKFTVLPLGVWDTVMLSIDSMGWFHKVFRVVSWRFSLDGGVDLVLQEDDAFSYMWDDGDILEVDMAPNTGLPSPFKVVPPINLAVYPTGAAQAVEIPGAHDDDPTTVAVNGGIRLTWQPGDAFAAHYVLVHQHLLVEVIRDNPRTVRVVQAGVASESVVTETRASINASALETAVLPSGEVAAADLRMINLFAVAAVNGIGARSGWSRPLYVDFLPPAIPPRVTGLELDTGGEFGAGNGTEWGGRDVRIKWRRSAASAPEIGTNPFGAGDGGADPHFTDYQVRVYDTGGNLLREVTTTDTAYTYAYGANAEDYEALHGAPGANRALNFEVRSRGRQGQVSEAAKL